MSQIYNTSGGFRKLHAFNFATIIHLGTISFCKRYVSWNWVYLLAEKKKFDPWLEGRDDITAANALIVLIQRATGLLGRQLNRLESDFIAKGGIREKPKGLESCLCAST